MSLTSVDLPDPDTPVTQVNVPSGIFTAMPLRLCSRGLWIVMKWPLPVRRAAGAGAEVDDIIRRSDRLFVVFHHQHGIAEVPKALEGFEKSSIVALVQSDRRLVQDVENPDETGADLRGQADSLPFATR